MGVSSLTSQTSNLKFKYYAIIVAGGSGSRMQSAVPKQFLLLAGMPVLMHTLKAFKQSRFTPSLILVLPIDYHDYWKQLCIDYNFDLPHQLVIGGETRFHSVKNGLNLIHEETDAVAAVHDAVRPLTDIEIIDHAYAYAAENGNAVVAVKSRDSVRQVKNKQSMSLLRDEIYLVQTPQTFKINLLKKAYLQPFDPAFTDDASVVEKTGVAIMITEGNYRNIKITFPEDIAIAELLLKQ
jgi:2-C-methyl-D-erythritol 4-phosphate cytidylyltransferase